MPNEEDSEAGDEHQEPKTASGEAGSATLTAASDRIRETATWLTVSFGAVGGAIIAGVQLTDLGDITGGELDRAVVGFCLAMLGVLVVVLAAAWVLTSDRATLQELRGDASQGLRKDLNDMVELRGGLGSIDELLGKLEQALINLAVARGAYRQAPDDDAKKAAFNNAKADFVWYRAYANRILETARYEKLRGNWRTARVLIGAGVVAAAAGAGLFAAQSPPDKDAEPAVAQDPVYVTFSLTETGTKAHAGSVGKDCSTTTFTGVATGSTDESVDVTVLPPQPEGDCRLVSLTLKRGEANITTATRVTVPDLRATDSTKTPPPDVPATGTETAP